MISDFTRAFTKTQCVDYKVEAIKRFPGAHQGLLNI